MDFSLIDKRLQIIRKYFDNPSSVKEAEVPANSSSMSGVPAQKRISTKRRRSSSANDSDQKALLKEKYEQDISNLEEKAKLIYEQFLKTPKDHPKYMEVWGKFWSVRSIQLQAADLDPSKYDLSDEWKVHFKAFLKVEVRNQLDGEKKALLKQFKCDLKQLEDDESEKKRKASEEKVKMSHTRCRSPMKKEYSCSHSRSPKRSRKYSSHSRSPRRSKYRRSPSPRHYRRSPSPRYNRRSPSPRHYRRSRSRSTEMQSRGRFIPETRHPNFRSRSPSGSRTSSPRIPLKQQFIKNNKNNRYKKVTVVSLCYDLMAVSSINTVYRGEISDLLIRAVNFEKKSKKEYCMTKAEAKLMGQIKEKILTMLCQKQFLYYEVTAAKNLRFNIDGLSNRWVRFTNNGNRNNYFNKKFNTQVLYSSTHNNNRQTSTSTAPFSKMSLPLRQQPHGNKVETVVTMKEEPRTPKRQEQYSATSQGNITKKSDNLDDVSRLPEMTIVIKNSPRIEQSKPEPENPYNNLATMEVSHEDMTDEEIVNLLNAYDSLSPVEEHLLKLLLIDIHQFNPLRFEFLEDAIPDQMKNKEEFYSIIYGPKVVAN